MLGPPDGMAELSLLRALPGYTLQTLLDEDARFLNLAQIVFEEIGINEQIEAAKGRR